MDAELAYQQQVISYDRVLSRGGFIRICDYQHRVSADDLTALDLEIKSSKDERPLHAFLASRPHLLGNAESAHGCRWFKSNPRLGKNYVPDFMIARMNSGGLRWTLVELQSPQPNLFIDTTKPGRAKPGEQLREGLDQISRWRGWID
ncbi:MAG: Shedu anti-phage system protein SduA domain-containing protein, partial [Pseudonocardiaceae bacterium]